MADNKTDSALITGQDSLRVFKGLNRGLSRRDALRMLGVAGVVAAGSTSLFGAAGKVFADDADAPVKGKPGGRIRVAGMSSSTADTLDPAKGALSTDYVRHFMFYNGLTRFDSHLVPHMELAEKIESDNAIVWTVTLRQGVTFHNGKALTAGDVVFSLSRHKDPATGSKVLPLMAQFSEIKATGPLEVQITLSSPNAELPSILAVSHLLIVPEGTTDFSKGIGTGPFTVKEFNPGVRSVSARNPNYWKPGLPYLDEIEFIAISDEPSRVNALLSGDVHMINEVNPRSTTRIAASAKHRVVDAPSGNYTDLIIRQDQMPGKSPEFTEAMKYLLDREQVKSAVFRGYACVGNDHPISPGSRYFNADLPQRLRPGKSQIPAQESRHGKDHHGRRGIACRHGFGGHRRAAATVRQTGRADPQRQPFAKRRLLVQPLDEAPAELRQHQPATERRRDLLAVLPVLGTVERIRLEKRSVRPVAAAGPRGNRRRQARQNVRRHADPGKPELRHRHPRVHQQHRRRGQARSGLFQQPAGRLHGLHVQRAGLAGRVNATLNRAGGCR